MKFIVKADKIQPALKWATKNLGPVVSKGGLSLQKETVEINGELKKVIPLYRRGNNWSLKDLTRDELDSTLTVNDAMLSAEDVKLFEQFLTDALSEEDNIIFTLKYL
jgi:hypothetical protein